MTTREEYASFEPTVMGSVWRYRWLVLAIVGGFVVLGVLASGLQPRNTQWSATATLVVEDPVDSALFTRTGQQSGRYVENQVAILRSIPVAERAQQLLAEARPPLALEINDIMEATEILGSGSSDVITVTFVADDELAAMEGANAITDAYKDVRRAEVARSFEASLNQLGDSIEESDAELARIQEDLDALREVELSQLNLIARFQDAIEQLDSLPAEIARGSEEDLPGLSDDLTAIIDELQDIEGLVSEDTQSAEQARLQQEESRAIDRKSDLTVRRDELEVDLELLGSGVLVASPAIEAEPPGEPSYIRNGILALLIGCPVAAGVAYVLALRRRTFTGRNEPELVLGVPLLAEVPDFREERIEGDLPVWDAPESRSAEGFRFAAAALDLRARSVRLRGNDDADRGISVAFVAADAEHGKTACVANTSIAAAFEGHRVLAIDADLGNQQLGKLLLQQVSSHVPVEAGHPAVSLFDIDLSIPNAGTLHLLTREGFRGGLPSFFASDEASDLFRTLEDEYDFVLVDVPPFLQVAYSSTLVSLLSAVAVVVPFGTRVTAIEEVRDRAELTGTPAIGYLFNRAPLRRDLRPSVATSTSARALAQSRQAEADASARAAEQKEQKVVPAMIIKAEEPKE